MHLEKSLSYPAPAGEVAALLADRSFVDEVCAAGGAVSHDVTVDGDPAGAFVVTSTRVLPTDELPDVARRFVGATLTLRQVDSWDAPAPDGSRSGTLALEVPGAPVAARAAMSLRPDGASGTHQVVDGDLTASVPLVGGRIEKAAVGPLLLALDQMESLAHRRLRASGPA